LKILIELPTWLGDTVMTTPAIESIFDNFPQFKLQLVGQKTSLEVYKNHPKIDKLFEISDKYIQYFSLARKIGNFDIFVSFRNTFRSRIFRKLIKASKKYSFNKGVLKGHQVVQYQNLINYVMDVNLKPGKLKLYQSSSDSNYKINSPAIGFNPGASYGNAKCWQPEKFVSLGGMLDAKINIYLLGDTSSIDINNKIETSLFQRNVTNLTGKTDISQLVGVLSKLSLLVTGDSGTMHLAAALGVPTITLFGPTKDFETSQWMNEKSIAIKKNLPCQPCMQRECPLKHHNCMKLIEAGEVFESVKKFL